MNRLPRITELIKVEPFKITCRWTTGEVRVIDFDPMFKAWGLTKVNTISSESMLLSYDTFKYVSISEQKTLQWINILLSQRYIDESGNRSIIQTPLTYDPDMLYIASKPLEQYKLVLVEDE